jgi:hypothetical protein
MGGVTTDPRLAAIRGNLRGALALELFVIFGNVVAIAATLGAFNGGQPTTTPLLAQAYFVVSFITTIGVVQRTRRALDAATAGDTVHLRRLVTRPLVFVAWFLCALLPGILLDAASQQIDRL